MQQGQKGIYTKYPGNPDISSILVLQQPAGRFFKKMLIKSNIYAKFVRRQPPDG
jgi:hypothetical protein